jgi:hypothetical protein
MRKLLFPLLAAAVAALGACGSGSQGDAIPSSSGGGAGDDGDAGSGMVLDDASFPPTGNSYVDARRCPACHQTQDPATTGFMSGATSPVPGDFGPGVELYGPNLTPDPTTGVGTWTDDQLSTAILSGIDNQGERLCPQMGHFPSMGPTELTSIIGYLRGLAPVVHQSVPSHCPPLKP